MNPPANNQSSDSLDTIFKVLILITIIILLSLLVHTAFFSTEKFGSKALMSLLPSGGIVGVFYVYMRFRIIELVISKGQHDPESLNEDFVNDALKLIPNANSIRGGNNG